VGARARVAHPEPGGAELTDQGREAEQRLGDQHLGDRRLPVRDVHVPTVRTRPVTLVPVAGDVGGDRMPSEQGVEPVDHRRLVTAVGCLEHRAEVPDEPAQSACVLGAHRGLQPGASVEEVDQLRGIADIGVHQRR
jgi:hypothetical protein